MVSGRGILRQSSSFVATERGTICLTQRDKVFACGLAKSGGMTLYAFPVFAAPEGDIGPPAQWRVTQKRDTCVRPYGHTFSHVHCIGQPSVATKNKKVHGDISVTKYFVMYVASWHDN